MKKHFPKIIAVTLGVAALAVSVPVSAFAKSSKPLSYLYTYQLTFDGYDTMSLSPDDTGTITAPALPEGAQYWQCNGKHVMPGEQFSYDQLDDWLCPSVDIDDGTGTHRTTGAYFMAITGDTAYVHYYANDTAVKTDAVFDGGVSEVPSTVNGKAVAYRLWGWRHHPRAAAGRDRDARRVHRGQHPGCGYPHRAAEGDR